VFPSFPPSLVHASRPLTAALALIAGPWLGAAEPECAALARTVSKQVTAKPERVLIIVEDTLVVSDACACEVVKAALGAAQASPKLAAQIVLVAVNAAPAKATVIAECAKAAAPDAAVEIDGAVREAIGSSSEKKSAPAEQSDAETSEPKPAAETPASASSDPKAPVAPKNPPAPLAPAESEADFGLSPVALGGVYLVYPGSSGSPRLIEDNGTLYLLGPKGQRIPLEPTPVRRRPAQPPDVIIIRPPSQTSSDGIPEDQTPDEPTPNEPPDEEPIPVDPPL